MVLQSPVKVQVLVSALNQDSKNLTEQMNIASDAVVVNQCDGYDYREWHTKSGRVQSFGMAERGVGLSRNTALLHADADICLFSDEDIVLEKDGAKYSNGEDSLFLRDCLRAGMRIYAVPDCIGEEMPRESGGSTWFHGFTEKFFKDRGVLYYYLYGKLAKVFSLRFLLKNKTGMCGEIPLKKAYRLMAEGIRSQKSIKKG